MGIDYPAALARQDVVWRALCGEATPGDLGKLEALLGVREFPSRVKCATLAWQALKNALAGGPASTSTEN